MSTCPIVVDLDGTLIHTDVVHESMLRILHCNPFNVIRMSYWLMQGRAILKQKLAERASIDYTALPYNQPLLEWLQTEKENGRSLVLYTAADSTVAHWVSDHLNIFDEVIASDGKTNLSGKNKALVLTQRFGKSGFDYAGNSFKDLVVWQQARQAIVVNASEKLLKQVKNQHAIEKIFPRPATNLTTWSRVLRVHQWLKNLLLFLPLLAAHQITNIHHWIALIFAFFAFSLCASGIYILNDLLDLESDRQHVRKKDRPFAKGDIPTWKGVVLIPLLLIGAGFAFLVNQSFCWCLFAYLLLTTAYSFRLKRFILIDSIALALLYTLRIISGNVAINIPLSYWLLTFSIFLFLSLAFVKRFAELQLQHVSGEKKLHGRGYQTTDVSLIQMFGVAAGYVSVLVLALYVNSEAVIKLYRAPELIWGAVPLTLFWISWIWMQANRGLMHDDPVIFAVKDKISLMVGILFALTLLIGAIGLPW